MVYLWILPILVITNVRCDTNNELHKQRRSLSPAKISRLNILSGKFEDQISPENYFPDIEYPKDILDAAKPFYFQASGDAILDPFPSDVRKSFKSISNASKTAKVPVTHNIELGKLAHAGLKSTSTSDSTQTLSLKSNTDPMNKENTTNELIDTIQSLDSETENNITEKYSEDSFMDDILTVPISNFISDPQELRKEIENVNANISSNENNSMEILVMPAKKVTCDSQESDEEKENVNASSMETNNKTEEYEQQISSLSEEIFTVPTTNLTFESIESGENIENNNANETSVDNAVYLDSGAVPNSMGQTLMSSTASNSHEVNENLQEKEDIISSLTDEV